jgi:hypothetical protein
LRDVLLSIKAAAALLGEKSAGGLYRKANNGELPVVMVKGQRMVESEGLEDLWKSITRLRVDSATRKTAQPAAAPPSLPPPTRPPGPPPDLDPTEVPNFNDERAWHEREKRLLAELERRKKTGELVYRADVEQAQMAVALTLKNQLEALPKQIKQQLPHLTIVDEEMIERLVAKVLTAVADWRMDQEEAGE